MTIFLILLVAAVVWTAGYILWPSAGIIYRQCRQSGVRRTFRVLFGRSR